MPACRRSFSIAFLLAAALCTGAAAKPGRVMSLNICTDQMLLALAPESRIASLTFMAREQAAPRLHLART